MARSSTFSINQQNDILTECLVRVPMHRQDFDDLVCQRIGR